jgi:hypothetical protein
MPEKERLHSWVSPQALLRFRMWLLRKPGPCRFGARAVLVIVLLAPSIWMLSVIPPLWKDVDAYIQVTQPPGAATILQYGPPYCFVARVPLYLGCAIESVRAGHSLPGLGFFLHPILTDSGVFVLLLLQHAALCIAGFYLITVISEIFWVRLVLAIAWAAIPLFYSSAHCVGGETLSMILTLLIGAMGLRIVRYSRKIPGKVWLLFGTLLWLSILTRHINAALAGLLPVTFVILAAYRLIATRFGRSQVLRRWRGLRARQALAKATCAIAIGFCCILLANVSVRLLSYATGTPYHSVVGLAFLGRLKFLAALSAAKRNELLDEVTRNTDSAEVKNFIALLRNEFQADTPNWDVLAFKEKVRPLLMSAETDTSDHAFNIVLNRTARAFLYPPNGMLLNAVAKDFKSSQQITIPDVVGFLFVTTRFYFLHRDEMPQCGSLVTFRGKDAAEVFAIFKEHSYFRHPKNVSYHALFLFWLISLGLFVAIARARGQEAVSIAAYAAALTAIGLLIMLANCLLAVFQPRYTLPMWELTIVSMAILFGGIMDSLFSSSLHLHSLRHDEQAKQADHL